VVVEVIVGTPLPNIQKNGRDGTSDADAAEPSTTLEQQQEGTKR
jgi:hypothetical protein